MAKRHFGRWSNAEVVAWCTGAATVGGAFAGFLASQTKGSPWHNLLFDALAFISNIAFLVLLGVGIAELIAWLRPLFTRTKTEVSPFVNSYRRWRLVDVANCKAADVGVHAATAPGAILPPYVLRDHDNSLRTALRNASEVGGFILLSGGSSTGKSRSMFEAVRDVLSDWKILLAEDPAAIKDAALMGAIRPRTIVWIDDTPAEKFITGLSEGLTAHDIHQLLADDAVIIVDSIWPSRYQHLTAQPSRISEHGDTPDPFRNSRDALAIAGDPIIVNEQFSFAERRRAQSLVARDRRLATALSDDDFGVTQALAGAPALVRRYRAAESAEPYAFAVMTAAIDARRLGNYNLFGDEFLREASLGYLTASQKADILSDIDDKTAYWFGSALKYLTDSNSDPGGVMPLIAKPDNTSTNNAVGYDVADYLLQEADRFRRGKIVPASVWDALSHSTDTRTLLRVADAAEKRLLYRYSLPMYRLVAKTGDDIGRMQLATALVNHGRHRELRSLARAGEHWARFQLSQSSESGKYRSAPLLYNPPSGSPIRWRREARSGETSDINRLSQKRELAKTTDGREELSRLVKTGDPHARSFLAAWLAENDHIDDAIEMIWPLAEARNQQARWRLAGWLITAGRIAELRQRADANDDDADAQYSWWLARNQQVQELTVRANAGNRRAQWRLADILVEHDEIDELRRRAETGDAGSQWRLNYWLFEHQYIDELRKRAEGGSPDACSRLSRLLAKLERIDELRQRADRGDDDAEWYLADWLFEHERVEELRDRANGGCYRAGRQLSQWLYQHDEIDELRSRAVGGDELASIYLLELARKGRFEDAARLIQFGLNLDASISDDFD